MGLDSLSPPRPERRHPERGLAPPHPSSLQPYLSSGRTPCVQTMASGSLKGYGDGQGFFLYSQHSAQGKEQELNKC